MKYKNSSWVITRIWSTICNMFYLIVCIWAKDLNISTVPTYLFLLMLCESEIVEEVMLPRIPYLKRSKCYMNSMKNKSYCNIFVFALHIGNLWSQEPLDRTLIALLKLKRSTRDMNKHITSHFAIKLNSSIHLTLHLAHTHTHISMLAPFNKLPQPLENLLTSN